MLRKLFSLFFSALICLLAFADRAIAQQKFTISGILKDAKNGETLIGAEVEAIGDKSMFSQTNEYGFYSITLPEGKYVILFSYDGYESKYDTIELLKDIKKDIKLAEISNMLNEVEINATADNSNITNPRIGVEKLSVQQINKLPVLFGERDIVKAVILLPGVKGSEGNGSFFVRGGGADQNLILLDEVLVYNPSHLLGFFSTFNSDALKNVTLYKGNMPAQYGGRISSVMDVQMKDGNSEKLSVNGGLGLIASRLSIEGPIVKGRGSFLISGRRTYADLFLKLMKDSTINKSILNFYDLNAKASYRINDKNRVFLSGYLGQDNLGLSNSFGLDWGNKTASIRWNHQVNAKLFSNTTLSYNDFAYNVDVNLNVFNSTIKSRIKDWALKEEFSYFLNTKNTIKFGLHSTLHTILPGMYTGDINVPNLPMNKSWENAVYFNNTWLANKHLTIDYGFRLSSFSVLGGEQPFYTLDEQNKIVDTSFYDKGSFVKNYFVPEPRLAINYIINSSLSIKGAYSRNAQYIHLLSNSSAGNPTDKWVGSNNIIQPSIGDQYSIGVAKNLKENMYELSFETYYKNMYNQIDYIDGANIISNEPLEEQLLFGRGRAYGAEFLIRKNKGKLTGWIGYTLSRTERKIDGINNGEWYVAKQDRTHDISVVGIYELSKRISLSGTFVYYTGNAVTFPSGKYRIDNRTVFLYSERNGYRMPAYHRLDLNATFQLGKPNKKYSSELVIGLYNVYGRQNAYAITFEDDPDDPSKTRAVQTSLFRYVPSISYNFKF